LYFPHNNNRIYLALPIRYLLIVMREMKETLDRTTAIKVLMQAAELGVYNPTKDSVMLMDADSDGVKSIGQQLHVKTELDVGSRRWLQKMLEAHQLTFIERENKIIIMEADS
jgi:hypothetical protein